jgi:uncharacterized membrane protein YqaE (UPF0057 family)
VAAAVSLAAPVAMAWHYGFDRATPMPAGAFALAILLCVLTWIPGLLLARHPLIHDPVFKKFQGMAFRLGRP